MAHAMSYEQWVYTLASAASAGLRDPFPMAIPSAAIGMHSMMNVQGQRLVERMLSGIHLHGAGAGRHVLNKKFGPLLMPLATAGKKAREQIFGTPQPAAAGIGAVGGTSNAVRAGTKLAGGPAAPGVVAKKVIRDGGKKKTTPTATAAAPAATAPKISWTNHGHKHFPKKHLSWKETIKETRYGDAKYKPEVNIEKLERMAWEKGTPVTSKKPWKVFKADDIIGATDGIETPYMRIEMSANTIHGHPITLAEYKAYLK